MPWFGASEGDQGAAKRPRLEGDDGPQADADPFVSPAEDILRMRVVWSEAEAREALAVDLSSSGDDGFFCPTFTHQVFGDDEVVKGYQDLSVKIVVHGYTLWSLVKIAYTSKRPGADDIEHALDENLGLQYTLDVAEFAAKVKESSAAIDRAIEVRRGAGQTRSMKTKQGDRCELIRFKPSEAGLEDLRAWHDRMQALPLLFIDGANYIDNLDAKWDVYAAVLHSDRKGKALAGFMTVYSFFSYPDRRRGRLSQILVVPPFRHRGIASFMIRAAYEDCAASGAVDLTVEDPSDEFQFVREKVDYGRVVGYGSFYVDATREALERGGDKLRNGFHPDTVCLPSKEVYAKAAQGLKICKLQFRKVHEALVHKALLDSNFPGGRSIVEKLVRSRLSNDAADQRTKEAAKYKGVFDVTPNDFIMVKISLANPGNEVPQPTDEEREATERAIQSRMAELDKLAV